MKLTTQQWSCELAMAQGTHCVSQLYYTFPSKSPLHPSSLSLTLPFDLSLCFAIHSWHAIKSSHWLGSNSPLFFVAAYSLLLLLYIHLTIMLESPNLFIKWCNCCVIEFCNLYKFMLIKWIYSKLFSCVLEFWNVEGKSSYL